MGTDPTSVDIKAADSERPVLAGAMPSAPGLMSVRHRAFGRGVLLTGAVGLGAAALAVMGAALGRLLAGTVLAGLSRRGARRPSQRPGLGASAGGR